MTTIWEGLTVDTSACGPGVDEPLAGCVRRGELGSDQGLLDVVTTVGHHRRVAGDGALLHTLWGSLKQRWKESPICS